jgi:hypothetical protein
MDERIRMEKDGTDSTRWNRMNEKKQDMRGNSMY